MIKLEKANQGNNPYKSQDSDYLWEGWYEEYGAFWSMYDVLFLYLGGGYMGIL